MCFQILIDKFQNRKIKDQHHFNKWLESPAVFLQHQSTTEEVEDEDGKLILKNQSLSGSSNIDFGIEKCLYIYLEALPLRKLIKIPVITAGKLIQVSYLQPQVKA